MRAALFAAEVHARQRGKGEGRDEPYVNHLLEVASLLADAGAPPATIIAGLLHDTLEDSVAEVRLVTRDDLAALFGEEVAATVAECTEDKALDWPVRKFAQVRHAPVASAAAKMVKLADKTSNLRRIRRTPPGWDHGRRVEYHGWAARIAAGCRGVSPSLDAAFEAAYRDGLAALAASAAIPDGADLD